MSTQFKKIMLWVRESFWRERLDRMRYSYHLLPMEVTINTMANLIELKDHTTGGHIERTACYTALLAKKLSEKPCWKSYLTERYIYDLSQAAKLHDIGKIGLPDYILRKPGKLSPEEFDLVKEHCQMGASVIMKSIEHIPFESYLHMAIPLIESHHENWDGSGYPKRLRGKDIPLSGRIMALADVYDALRTKRNYKEELSHPFCIEYIIDNAGIQFDPELVDAFIEIEDRINCVAKELRSSAGNSVPIQKRCLICLA